MGGKGKKPQPEIREKIDADQLANSLTFIPDSSASLPTSKKSSKTSKKTENPQIVAPSTSPRTPRPSQKAKKKPKNRQFSMDAQFDSDDLPTPVNEPQTATPSGFEPRSPKNPPKAPWTFKDLIWVLTAVVLVSAVFWLKAQEEAWTATAGVKRESENLYEVLHLDRTASQQEVKQAYKKLAVLLHPDKNTDCLECAEKFAKVVKAYETLGNTDRRKIYDETRGAFETLPSDYSIELTHSNFHELVEVSPDLWVIQVFSDVDGSSRQFAPFWESVAMEFHGKIKFGRINARTQKDAVTFLPIRARNFPTVVLLSKAAYPAIFPLTDLSREAFRAWIAREIPDAFVGASDKPLVILETKRTPSLDAKLAALNWKSVFSFEVAPDSSRPREVFKLTQDLLGDGGKSSESTLTSFARRFSVELYQQNAERLCRGAFCVGGAARVDPKFPKANIQSVHVKEGLGYFVYDFDDELIVRGLKEATINEILDSENAEELIEDLLFQPFSRHDFRQLLESEVKVGLWIRWRGTVALVVSSLAGLVGLFKLSQHVDFKPLLFVLLGSSIVVSLAPAVLNWLK